jgi:hypothetical protein
MARLDLGGRIMLAMSAGTVLAASCGGGAQTSMSAGAGGGSSTAHSSGAKAASSTTGGGAPTAGSVGASMSSSGAGGAAPMPDGGEDATSPDGDGQACSTVGSPCTAETICCTPAVCIAQHCVLSVRRPFLVGSSLRRPDAVPREDWQPEAAPVALPDAHLDARTADALARDWLHDGCEEYASIAAFARFTMHLVSVGAPPEMIAESQRAAIDEIEHARACFALAERYGGRTMGPGELSLEGAMPPVTLAEIAALTAEEGCVGETLGVLLAEQQLAMATDPVVRSLLANAHIVDDEARHAELAWRFVAWAVARGGEPVRIAVRAAIRRAVADTLANPIRSYDGVDVAAWRAHGRLTCADALAVAARGVREIVEPCAAALLGDPPPSRSTDAWTCAA